MFAAVHVKGVARGTKVLEGPMPEWKFFGQRGTGNGAAGTTVGLPRFKSAMFTTKYPFGNISLVDDETAFLSVFE
jgi:hypothetical protein